MKPTQHDYRNFVFTIDYQPSDPAYTVTYPDFPEIITRGATLAAAFANACEALIMKLPMGQWRMIIVNVY